MDWYELSEKNVGYYFKIDNKDYKEITYCLEYLENLFIIHKLDDIVKFVYEKMSPSWLEDEEDLELTWKDYYDKLSFESIQVNSDGTFEIFFFDGDLYFGHAIVVNGSKEELKDVEMMG